MERLISQSLRRELEKQESGEELLVFLTITHPSLDEAIRVVCDPEDFIYDGETYIGFIFDIAILSDNDRPPETRLTVQNVDEQIGHAIKSLIGPPRVKIEILALSDFDTSVIPRVPLGTPTVEYRADQLFLVDVDGDDGEITGRITSWDYSQTTYPGIRATQRRCPGLYK